MMKAKQQFHAKNLYMLTPILHYVFKCGKPNSTEHRMKKRSNAKGPIWENRRGRKRAT